MTFHNSLPDLITLYTLYEVFSLLDPNIFIGIIFSNYCRLYSFLKIRDHVFQPCSTKGKIIYCFVYFNF
jgi:hypothetical protein